MLMATDDDFIKINAGAVAEQFVAQELMAYQDPYVANSLYYWAREARNSNAEVDDLFASLAMRRQVGVPVVAVAMMRSPLDQGLNR